MKPRSPSRRVRPATLTVSLGAVVGALTWSLVWVAPASAVPDGAAESPKAAAPGDAKSLPEPAAAALAEFRKVDWAARARHEHGTEVPDGWQAGLRAEWQFGALDRAHVPAVAALLRDDDRFVRALAARALGVIGDPAATPELIQSLRRETDQVVVVPVVQALARTGGEGALAAVEELQKPGVSPVIQRHIGFARRQLKGGAWDLESLRGEHRDALRAEIASAELGEPAPELALPSTKGPVNLSVFADRPIVLAFVHGDLGPKDNRVIARLQLEGEFLRRHAVEVVLVVPHEKERAEIWSQKAKHPYHVACDPAGRAAAVYGVGRQLFADSEWLPSPAWFVIDRKGRLAWSFHGTKLGDHVALGTLFPVIEDVAAGIDPRR